MTTERAPVRKPWMAAAIVVVAAIAVIALVARWDVSRWLGQVWKKSLTSRWLRRRWQEARAGGKILSDRRAHVRRVVVPQVLS